VVKVTIVPAIESTKYGIVWVLKYMVLPTAILGASLMFIVTTALPLTTATVLSNFLHTFIFSSGSTTYSRIPTGIVVSVTYVGVSLATGVVSSCSFID